ncbi:MAG: squalene/phytoene synthase family protein, partial [Planctomycetota bacterium]
AEIADQSHDPRIRKFITEAQRKLLQRADQFYRSGAEGFPSLPFRARLSIRTAAVVYREIGTQILEGKVNWWEGRSVVTSSRKLNLTLAALTQGDDLLTQQANESPDLPGELMQYALLKATP